MKTTATRETVLIAMNIVNENYGYKLSLKRDEQKGKWFHFTITSPSKIPGARTSWSGRNLAAASWHAHGYLFDQIFKFEPNAIIYSIGQKITIDGGNWQDRNIGSMMCPCMYSETSIL